MVILKNLIQKMIKQKFDLNISVSKLSKIINSEFFTKINLTNLIDLLGAMESRGILYSKSGIRKSRDSKIKTVDGKEKIEIREVDDFYDLKDVKEKLIGFFNNQELTANDSKAITEILIEFIDDKLPLGWKLPAPCGIFTLLSQCWLRRPFPALGSLSTS